MIKGSYLEDPRGNGVLLGDRLARTLQVGLGDRVVLTCARPNGGDLVQEMFRVLKVGENWKIDEAP